MTSYVNNIQKVSITINALSTTGTATINAASGTQFIIWNGETCDQTINISECLCYLSISGTTITATRALGTAGTITVVCSVVDATVSLIKTVQTGTISITAGNSTGTATVSSVTANNTVLQFLGYNSTGTVFDVTDTPVLSISGTTVTAALSTTVLGVMVVGFTVIEFQGAALNSSTQAVATAWSNTSQTTIATITSVTQGNAMLFYGGAQCQQSTDFQYSQLTSATQITITSGVANFEAVQYNCYVANFISAVMASNVQRGTISLTSATSNTATVTGTGTNSIVNFTGFGQTSGSTANYNIIETDLTYSSPTVTGIRNTGTGTMVVGYEVIDFAVTAATNTVTETVTESDSETILATDSGLITQTITETDSAIIKATDSVTLTESQTESDSYVSGYYYTNTLTENITVSDSRVILATQNTTKSENNTATDSIVGSATGLTNLNETGTATDTHQGIASGSGLFSENITESDLFVTVDIESNTLSESITLTDSANILATDIGLFNENIAANDNYDSQLTPNPGGVVAPIITGSGNDPWRKHLKWLAKKKKKQFKKLAKTRAITEQVAIQIAELASTKVQKQESQIKETYRLEPDVNLARHAIQQTVSEIYNQTWEQETSSSLELQKNILQKIADEKKQYEEEFFMLVM